MQNDHWAPRTRIFLGHQRIEETYQLVCRAEVTGDRSLNCGRCQAICPQGAVTVGAIDETMSEFVTFRGDSNWLAYGEFNTGQLVRLMASWRPCPDHIALIHLRFINFLNTSALICDMQLMG